MVTSSSVADGSTLRRRRRIRKRLENVLAGDNAGQPVVAVDHGNAPDAVLDHELEHPRQFGVGANVDEFRGHDVGDGPVHQIARSAEPSGSA